MSVGAISFCNSLRLYRTHLIYLRYILCAQEGNNDNIIKKGKSVSIHHIRQALSAASRMRRHILAHRPAQPSRVFAIDGRRRRRRRRRSPFRNDVVRWRRRSRSPSPSILELYEGIRIRLATAADDEGAAAISISASSALRRAKSVRCVENCRF